MDVADMVDERRFVSKISSATCDESVRRKFGRVHFSFSTDEVATVLVRGANVHIEIALSRKSLSTARIGACDSRLRVSIWGVNVVGEFDVASELFGRGESSRTVGTDRRMLNANVVLQLGVGCEVGDLSAAHLLVSR